MIPLILWHSIFLLLSLLISDSCTPKSTIGSKPNDLTYGMDYDVRYLIVSNKNNAEYNDYFIPS